MISPDLCPYFDAIVPMGVLANCPPSPKGGGQLMAFGTRSKSFRERLGEVTFAGVVRDLDGSHRRSASKSSAQGLSTPFPRLACAKNWFAPVPGW